MLSALLGNCGQPDVDLHVIVNTLWHVEHEGPHDFLVRLQAAVGEDVPSGDRNGMLGFIVRAADDLMVAVNLRLHRP
jgi:hypothetical protein